jgi:NAD(P)H-nitrite reductase large subunit
MTKYLIIGNSAAGVNAADAIRMNDNEGSIKIVSRERFMAYGRPLISYYLSGKVTPDNMYYRSESYYKLKNIEVLLNVEAKSADLKNKEVVTVKGERIKYDKLLIATGSCPFIPYIKGLDMSKQENVFTFSAYEDAINLKKKITKKSKVVIAGAGLIGLKAAEGLFGQVESITIVDLADRIMASVLDKQAAGIVQAHIEQNNISFKLQTSICEIYGENNVSKVVLSSNEFLDCDVLIIAVGVRPNIGIANVIGLKMKNGIIVNEYMQTSENDVYAAGDCIESLDLFSGDSKVFALWNSASNQGEAAGLNMAGVKTKSPVVFSTNAISFFGLQLISAGVVNTLTPNNIILDLAKSKLFRLNILNDNLIGFVLINCEQRAGIYTDLMSDKVKLSTLEYDITLKDVDFSIYPKEERIKKILGTNV